MLERASAGWRGITYTPDDVRQLQITRRDPGLTRGKERAGHDDAGGDATAAA